MRERIAVTNPNIPGQYYRSIKQILPIGVFKDSAGIQTTLQRTDTQEPFITARRFTLYPAVTPA
jgi:hypothetical protein